MFILNVFENFVLFCLLFWYRGVQFKGVSSFDGYF